MSLVTLRKRLTQFREWRARRDEVRRCAENGPYCYKCRARKAREIES